MPKITFYKYQGAGNDFIIIDHREQIYNWSPEIIEQLCHRRFGIGADGLMLIEKDAFTDFRMVYYNADGHESTMCGNGGRCIIRAAHDLNIIDKKTFFNAIDGEHSGEIMRHGDVQLGMININHIDEFQGYKVMNTGSPHIVVPVKDLQSYNVFQEGRALRENKHFGPKGINVNFIENIDDILHIRTYERGVEDETWACGTGVTAAAISSVPLQPGQYSIPVKAKGGLLHVDFIIKDNLQVENIFLTGPAEYVFTGNINIEF